MTSPPLAPFPTVRAPRGMVCAVDHLASNAGVAMLRAGGTAADAAIATSAVLAVTAQNNCGMGGDLFALVHHTDGEAPACLDAAGRAGSGADPEQLRAEGHTSMPFTGDIRSVPVPGCVDGWMALHQRFGRLPLAEVLDPARQLADHGFPASPLLALMAPFVHELPGAHDFHRPGGLREGDRVTRPGVARTLAAIGAEGRDAFYGGEFGDGLLKLGAGEFTIDDLAAPQSRWVEPLQVEVWGHRVWTVPPVSQGYLTLAGVWLAEASGFGAARPEPHDSAWAHHLVEAAKQAGWDRPAVLHENADGRSLIAAERLGPRAERIRLDQASAVGAPAGDGDTVHLAAVDSQGTAVSLIQSNAAGFGANIVVDPPGIFLHNRGIGFSLERGHPAEYGPGRRPPHTLSPALVTRPSGELAMVLGTMGGDSQPQVLLQLLARLLVAEEDPATAIASGRWTLRGSPSAGGFDTWASPDQLVVALEGHAPAWDDGLAARGHRVERRMPFDHGAGHAHVIVAESDHLAAASDPRAGAGAAQGF